MVSPLVAQHMGIDVGKNPRVAMTTPGRVVFIDESRDRWCAASTREARALVHWDGDELLLPPFRIEVEAV